MGLIYSQGRLLAFDLERLSDLPNMTAGELQSAPEQSECRAWGIDHSFIFCWGCVFAQ